MKTYRQVLRKTAAPVVQRPGYTYAQMAQLNSGDPYYWQNMKQHLKKNFSTASNVFQPRSIIQFYNRFNPNLFQPITPKQSYGQGSFSPGPPVNSQLTRRVKAQLPVIDNPNSYRFYNAVRSIFPLPFDTKDMKDFSSTGQQLIWHADHQADLAKYMPNLQNYSDINSAAGHQFNHGVASNTGQKFRDLLRQLLVGPQASLYAKEFGIDLNKSIQEQLRKKFKTPTGTLTPKLSTNISGALPDLLIDPYAAIRTQAVQAALSTNQGRNLVAKTLRQHPWAYPKMSPITKFYMMYYMPKHFSGDQKGKKQWQYFYNSALLQPALFNAHPIDARRDLGTVYGLKSPRQLTAGQHFKLYGQNRKLGITDQQRQQWRNSVRDYNDKLYVLR